MFFLNVSLLWANIPISSIYAEIVLNSKSIAIIQ